MCCVEHENGCSFGTIHGSFKTSPAIIHVLPNYRNPGTGFMNWIASPYNPHADFQTLVPKLVNVFTNSHCRHYWLRCGHAGVK